MTDTQLDLGRLTHLQTLFRLFNNGKHLNRAAEPALWAELEREQEPYQSLFEALGYELRIDGRGFAWFHTEDATSNVNKATRQLALLFMVIFDTQADAGRPLMRFEDWVIDATLLHTVHEQHQELLHAEELTVDGLQALLDTAVRFGFAATEGAGWRLLPAVCRYLDHIEELARAGREAGVDALADENEPGDDAP